MSSLNYEREQHYSLPLDMTRMDSHNFATSFPLRIHKSSEIAQLGTDALRLEWRTHVGPVTRFGSHNPRNGHCCALMFPFCRPERLWLIAYVIEYVFLFDTVLESSERAAGFVDHRLVVDENQALSSKGWAGTRILQGKMFKMLNDIDEPCGDAVEKGWNTMVQVTTLLDKSKGFDNLDHYLEFRVADAGAPLCLALMQWGMSLRLTTGEQHSVAPLGRLAYAATALANDIMSFDQEYRNFEQLGVDTLINAVWLQLRWGAPDVKTAKDVVNKYMVKYEKAFCKARDELLRDTGRAMENVKRYLDGLSHQMAGYAVWHLNCPRYHVEMRKGLEGYVDATRDEAFGEEKGKGDDGASLPYTASDVDFLMMKGLSRETAVEMLKGDNAIV